MARRLTLERIGRRAGVSRSTVSRAINDHEDVSDDVKERVLVLDVLDRETDVARRIILPTELVVRSSCGCRGREGGAA